MIVTTIQQIYSTSVPFIKLLHCPCPAFIFYRYDPSSSTVSVRLTMAGVYRLDILSVVWTVQAGQYRLDCTDRIGWAVQTGL